MEIKVFDGQTLIRSFQFPIGYYANRMADLGYETVEFCLEVKKTKVLLSFLTMPKNK